MSATFLRRLDMNESTRRLFHETATTLKGRIQADLIFGRVSQSPLATKRQVYIPLTKEERELSRSQCTCAKCTVDLTSVEIKSNTFEFEGKTSFYLCDKCHREIFLTGSSKPPAPRQSRVEVDDD